MWEQSLLTAAGQVEALRLLAEWWDSSRRGRPASGLRRAGGTARGAAADVPVPPTGWRPAHLDERLAG
jgi:hypothetical protein